MIHSSISTAATQAASVAVAMHCMNVVNVSWSVLFDNVRLHVSAPTLHLCKHPVW